MFGARIASKVEVPTAWQGCSGKIKPAPDHLYRAAMPFLCPQNPRDEQYAKAEEALGPDTLVLVRKIRTLQVGVGAWPGSEVPGCFLLRLPGSFLAQCVHAFVHMQTAMFTGRLFFAALQRKGGEMDPRLVLNKSRKYLGTVGDRCGLPALRCRDAWHGAATPAALALQLGPSSLGYNPPPQALVITHPSKPAAALRPHIALPYWLSSSVAPALLTSWAAGSPRSLAATPSCAARCGTLCPTTRVRFRFSRSAVLFAGRHAALFGLPCQSGAGRCVQAHGWASLLGLVLRCSCQTAPNLCRGSVPQGCYTSTPPRSKWSQPVGSPLPARRAL